MHAHIPLSFSRFALQLAQGSVGHHSLGTESHGGVVLWATTVPRAPLPERRRYRHPARESNPCRRALPRLYRSYGLMRQTEILSPPSAPALDGESLQVAACPCWKSAFPGVISANLSPDAWTLTPVAPMVHRLVSSHRASAFPLS